MNFCGLHCVNDHVLTSFLEPFSHFSKNCSTIEAEEKGTGRKWGENCTKTLNSYALILNSRKCWHGISPFCFIFTDFCETEHFHVMVGPNAM